MLLQPERMTILANSIEAVIMTCASRAVSVGVLIVCALGRVLINAQPEPY